MIECSENHVVPDLTSITEGYASMVLKMTTGIDENILADVDVFPEIGVKRRENPTRWVDIMSEKAGKQSPNLFLRMVTSVQFKSDTACFVAHLVHKTMDLFRVQRFPCRNVG